MVSTKQTPWKLRRHWSNSKKPGRSIYNHIKQDTEETLYARKYHLGETYENDNDFGYVCDRCGLKYAHCSQCCGCIHHVGYMLRQDAQLLHDILVEYYETDPDYHHKIPQITKLLHESNSNYYSYDAILDRD